ELPRIHDFFCCDTKRRAGLDGRTEHIAGGNLWNAVALLEERRLCALACAGRAEKDQSHDCLSVLVNDSKKTRAQAVLPNNARVRSRSSSVSTPAGGAVSVTTIAMR